MKDKILHHGHEKHHEDSSKGKTSAAAMRTPEQLEAEKEAENKKKNSTWHKIQDYSAKQNQKQDTDDIWGHYRGPGH